VTSSVFKIRNNKGLWSTGGSSPSFTNRGKVWPSRGAVSGHLAMFYESRYRKQIEAEEWQIVEIEIKESELLQTSVISYFDRKRKLEKLIKKYGKNISGIYDVLEKDNKVEEYRWLIVVEFNVNAYNDKLAKQELATLIKQTSTAGIKRTEYRSKSGSSMFKDSYKFTAVFAFQTRERAAFFRLNCQHSCSFLDLVDVAALT
jgi:hypothetical protein